MGSTKGVVYKVDEKLLTSFFDLEDVSRFRRQTSARANATAFNDLTGKATYDDSAHKRAG
jgi:hypothetical protein